jgi:hypothetical protein
MYPPSPPSKLFECRSLYCQAMIAYLREVEQKSEYLAGREADTLRQQLYARFWKPAQPPTQAPTLLDEAITRFNRIILLSDSGAGKSHWLLNHVRMVARASRQQLESMSALPDRVRLPVFVQHSDLADALETVDGGASDFMALKARLESAGATANGNDYRVAAGLIIVLRRRYEHVTAAVEVALWRALVENGAHHGGITICLDAWHRITTATHHNDAIRRFARACPTGQIFLAARRFGWDDSANPLFDTITSESQGAILTICPLRPAEIASFVTSFFAADPVTANKLQRALTCRAAKIASFVSSFLPGGAITVNMPERASTCRAARLAANPQLLLFLCMACRTEKAAPRGARQCFKVIERNLLREQDGDYLTPRYDKAKADFERSHPPPFWQRPQFQRRFRRTMVRGAAAVFAAAALARLVVAPALPISELPFPTVKGEYRPRVDLATFVHGTRIIQLDCLREYAEQRMNGRVRSWSDFETSRDYREFIASLQFRTFVSGFAIMTMKQQAMDIADVRIEVSQLAAQLESLLSNAFGDADLDAKMHEIDSLVGKWQSTVASADLKVDIDKPLTLCALEQDNVDSLAKNITPSALRDAINEQYYVRGVIASLYDFIGEFSSARRVLEGSFFQHSDESSRDINVQGNLAVYLAYMTNEIDFPNRSQQVIRELSGALAKSEEKRTRFAEIDKSKYPDLADIVDILRERYTRAVVDIEHEYAYFLVHDALVSKNEERAESEFGQAIEKVADSNSNYAKGYVRWKCLDDFRDAEIKDTYGLALLAQQLYGVVKRGSTLTPRKVDEAMRWLGDASAAISKATQTCGSHSSEDLKRRRDDLQNLIEAHRELGRNLERTVGWRNYADSVTEWVHALRSWLTSVAS